MVCWIFSFVRGLCAQKADLYRLYKPGSFIFRLSNGSRNPPDFSNERFQQDIRTWKNRGMCPSFPLYPHLELRCQQWLAAIRSYPVGPKVSIYCFPLLNNIALSGSPLIQIQLWLSPGFSKCSLPFVSSVEVLQGKALSLLPSRGTSELVTGSHCCSLLLLTSCCGLDMVLSA